MRWNPAPFGADCRVPRNRTVYDTTEPGYRLVEYGGRLGEFPRQEMRAVRRNSIVSVTMPATFG